MYHYTKFGRAS